MACVLLEEASGSIDVQLVGFKAIIPATSVKESLQNFLTESPTDNRTAFLFLCPVVGGSDGAEW